MNVHGLALAGLSNPRLFTFRDLAGTFAFAISGAAAARSRSLDWFGVIVVAFAVACGGGLLRELCIGAVPPTGLTDWRYLAVATSAAIITLAANPLVVRLAQLVTLFDSLGLGLFAVTGAQKAMIFGHDAEVAVLLGVVSAVGGGVMRDVLLNRVPEILQRQIYALAAVVAAGIEVAGERLAPLQVEPAPTSGACPAPETAALTSIDSRWERAGVARTRLQGAVGPDFDRRRS